MPDDDISLEVDTRELEAALAALPKRIAGNIMREALQSAGDVMLEAMVAHAPERTDEETPDSNSLPPGILKYDLTTEVTIGTASAPRVKVGPTQIAGRVARWQENGWMLTGHGKSRKGRTKIRQIAGKHFMAASFDESSDRAVDVFLQQLASGLGQSLGNEGAGPEDYYGGENY